MKLNVPTSATPINCKLAMIAIPIKVAIKPYSMTVAPLSSAKNCLKTAFTANLAHALK